ncbi:hypothetical protein [Brevibacillus massiliensis]|jgi:hypothetical protein|uniref:hypothetical protein n=1 Tax=Brevibacillus massiliensis TaxID=1118054 RepID=UPI0002EFD2F1|nr:hypothetical protein [Brevibacillus massiliensis]
MKRDEISLIKEYIKTTNTFKMRRLIGLAVISMMLMASLGIIYANGWSDLSGDSSSGWLLVGLFVSASAIAAVIIDLVWRK